MGIFIFLVGFNRSHQRSILGQELYNQQQYQSAACGNGVKQTYKIFVLNQVVHQTGVLFLLYSNQFSLAR